MENLQPKKPETIVYSGKIGEMVQEEQPNGRIYERFRRPPGTRLVIIDTENRILITREYRTETGNYDLRLPGGKVCDSLDEYHALLNSGQDIEEEAKKAATKEALEETGLVIHGPELITVAKDGATVEWDLHYYSVTDFEPSQDGQQLEHGEDIEVTWMRPDEIRSAIGNGEMQEWRSVGVLMGTVLPSLES
jgi:8-oxo-dGTP pyrophosphatase MutT (NUDIX family)